MLNPQVAAERLKEFQTENPLDAQTARVRSLPEPARVPALAFLGLMPDEKPYVTEVGWSNWKKRSKQDEALAKAREEAGNFLDALPANEREAFFAAFFPRLGSALSAWWAQTGSVLYQTSYNRRPFRLTQTDTNRSDAQFNEVRQWLRSHFLVVLENARPYQEMPADWFAAWTPYLGANVADTFGKIFAAVIDTKTPEGDAVFDTLLESARGDHAVGAMGRHVVRGLLSASRPDGWEFLQRLLLAAQRQEGLRQSILEVVDEAHPQAFRQMLQTIRENDLFRFSATIRAADVWFGMNWVAYEKLSVKQANAATEMVETFLADPAARDQALQGSDDGQTVYLALWSMAFDDAQAALEKATVLLSDSLPVRRYAALHLMTELRLGAAKPAIANAFDDPDLRIAQKAFSPSSREGDDDYFERIERNMPRFPTKPQELAPMIWEWDKLTAHAETLADALSNVLNTRPIDRLFPYLPLMSSYGRARVVKMIGEQKNKTAEMRDVLFDMAGDAASYVRSGAFESLQKFDINPTEAEKIESLLSRKAADLRKGALTLLLKQHDQPALDSGKRLTGSGNVNQRAAGLDLLTQMADKKRKPDEVKAVVQAFAASRENKLTDAETRMIAPLLTSEPVEKPTLDNALGLLDTTKRTFAPAPVEKSRFTYVTNSSHAVLSGLNDFVQKNKEVPVPSRNANDGDQTLLGNITYAWYFPQPDYSVSLDADKEKLQDFLPLLTDWWQSRPATMRDRDGWELLRAPLALSASTGARGVKKEVWPQLEPLLNPAPATKPVTPALLAWLVRLFPIETAQGEVADFYLDAAETVFARIVAPLPAPQGMGGMLKKLVQTVTRLTETHPNAADEDDETSETDEKEAKQSRLLPGSRAMSYLQAARLHRQKNETAWTPEQTTRLWHLLRWADEPTPETKGRNRVAEISDIAAALAVGAANEHDVYDQLLTAHEKQYNRFNELQHLSGRKNTPLMDATPGLREIVDTCRKRILEVETRRGDMETAASQPALALRWSGGMDVLLQLVAALGKDTFTRGYSYYGQTNRANVFSHLIRAAFPGESDTPDAFTQAAKALQISEKRLIETAVYAPQWAGHVEKALQWNGLAQAIWWLHAHTKDNSWSVEAEVREAWTAEIADKTPLSAADLTEGAVDVEWFNRVYKTVGETRWAQINEAAKYASSAGGHKRAQLFAEAMLGMVKMDELLPRIADKRHQDSLRALGLLPLPTDAKKRENDVLRRYKVMSEFVRTSKQFGAQRQESEKLAARIGMENLARTAGYADPLRLTWAMEAAANADLQSGSVTETVGEVNVTLSINGLGLPEIAVVKKNKTLANIPPAVKKDEKVAALVARKTEITRQVSRMREGLEGAMCRGDLFTPAELANLLEHPVLRPLLQNLVFMEDGGKEPIMGYPVIGGGLEDSGGVVSTVDGKTNLRLAHPYDLLQTGHWDGWQKDCFLRERVQPFKQVFRELYVLTEGEKTDKNKSRRYAGHQVNPKQALGLFGKRGWIGGGDYDYDSDGPRKTFHEADLCVSVGFMGTTFGPADVEGSTIEEIYFTKKGGWESLPLETVPPRVFSEAMRDLDLVVSVAHVGGVDPEASQSTVEMRTSLLRQAMTLLKLNNVRFEKSHALVDGALATYNVHLGSAVVHRQPGGYLCIVPVHSQHRGRLFLPFVDDDPRTAEVISKVLLLARDNEIKDPTILEQILAVK